MEEKRMIPADEMHRIIDKAEFEGFITGDIEWLHQGVEWLVDEENKPKDLKE